MKKTKLLYWIFTILFSALMVFSSYGSIVLNEESIKIFGDYLGYPNYFIRFTGIAKVLGVIAILIPGFPRIKEWAYAGLFFDLFAAVYSGIAIGGFDPMMLTMLIWIVPGILSYYFYHKLNKALYFETK
ncbi:DoxX family protein [Ferruginibacter sp. SUN002]|uniref:DoxX family protein n=1 Tax=Ferruginibacter sp. SUN002 TaxID=2937789 RepID=UPI003D36C5B8